jgi:hypothetical protein
MPDPIHLNTGTAADLLSFEYFDHLEKGRRLTRTATVDQEFLIKDWDGELYVIKFDKNFSKKHLFTFSKDQERTIAQAKLEAQKPGQAGQDAQNWERAEYQLLKNKIEKGVNKRAVVSMCRCGHAYNRHPGGGHCNQCACAAFHTQYADDRQWVHKPTINPIQGASTTTNTCIVLNWVPRNEFEDVVVKSIQAEEKPPGWTKGQPLAVLPTPVIPPNGHNASQRELRWDFLAHRSGAVLKAQRVPVVPAPVPANPADPANFTFNYTNYHGCWVKAQKTASVWGK